ncbi:Ger(x)C family spore germination protein [Heyndrickxia sp. NPDC080065]|uniref:Ger(x)C family spore germination protein n=1 Tax=Heyndrickxia sp. NPDC080065 TaxID=3390568 RepID=UPI003D0803F8
MYKLFISSFLILFLLSGCGNKVELNNLAIVLSAAIDLTDEGEIELTLQLLNPKSVKSSAESAGGGSSNISLIKTGKGLTVADAASKLQEQISRKIFWGHCKVFIFGERMAKYGVKDAIDFIIRAPQTREHAMLFISNGEAKQALSVIPSMEDTSGRVLFLLSKLKVLMSVTLKDFVEMKLSSSHSSAIPYVDIVQPNDNSQETIPYIHGTAVLKQGKMVGTLDDSLTRGVKWIKNEVRDSQVVVKNPLGKGTITLSPFQASTQLIPIIKDGKWKIIMKSRAEGEIIENETKLDLMNIRNLHIVEKEMEADIRKRIQKAYSKLQKDLNADIVGFADAFHRKYPKEWKKVKGHWDEVFKNVQLDIEVDAHITGPGLLTIPSE